jgi:hypothetical protein
MTFTMLDMGLIAGSVVLMALIGWLLQGYKEWDRLANELRGQNADLARELMTAKTRVQQVNMEVATERERSNRLEKEAKRLAMELESQKARSWRRTETGLFLEELARMDLTTDEVKFAIGRISEDDPEYLSIMKTISRQYEVELETALRPGLCNEDRQFGAGRSSAVADVLHMIESMRREGLRMAEEANKPVAAA